MKEYHKNEFQGITLPFKMPNPFYKPNHTRNQFAQCVSNLTALGDVSMSEFDQAYQDFSREYKDYEGFWFDVIYNPAGRILLSVCRTYELFNARYLATLKRRMIALLLRAKQNDVSPQNMDDFIKAAPMELQNPRTNKPFEWDGEFISFEMPDKTVKVPYLIR
jgi:hypothetical protein